MLNRRLFSKCLPSTNLDFHCFFQQNSTSQEEYETARTGTTPQYFILSPFQYCNDVTLFSKVVSILISVVSWLSTENTFVFLICISKKRKVVSFKHFDFLKSQKICSCLRAFSKVKFKRIEVSRSNLTRLLHCYLEQKLLHKYQQSEQISQ